MSGEAQRIIESLILGDSPVIRDLRQRIARVAKTGLAVLIEGPTGAGKELVAQALHGASSRSGDCVAVNVCAIAEGMFEDAFFGHARGAFTGAISDHAGYLTEAHRGTIFLDEIGGLGLMGQAKLLRAIETKQFRPVGARADQTSDFRVISASNTPLERLTRASAFRADLAERLRAVRLEVPALRLRGGDSVLLASHFASRHGKELSARAKRAVEDFAWPGNVRQLRNVIDCAASYTDRDRMIDECILRECLEPVSSLEESGPHFVVGVAPQSFKDRRLFAVLEETNGNIERAAALLGVHRATLYRRLNRLRERAAGAADPPLSALAVSGLVSHAPVANSRDNSRRGDAVHTAQEV